MASAQKKLPLSPWGDGLTFRAGHALVRTKKRTDGVAYSVRSILGR